MKKYFIMAVMAVFAASVFAQETTTTEKSEDSGRYFGSLYVRYSPGTFIPNQGTSQAFNGVSTGLLGHSRLTKSIPSLFYEVDLGLQYSFYSENNSDFSMLSAYSALGICYKFDIPNAPISIIPKAGIDLNSLWMAKIKSGGQKINLRSKDDMGSSDATWNDLEFGCHAGVDFWLWKHLFVGFSYVYYMTPIAKDLYMAQANISVGYCF